MKQLLDFKIADNIHLTDAYSLLKVTPVSGETLPDMKPGQFVQVHVPGATDTLLRRPISINFVDVDKNQLWLLVRRAGKATNALADATIGSQVNLLLPLGNGFNKNILAEKPCLLVGGGVGIAPLLYLGFQFKQKGITFEYLVGAKSESDLLQVELLKEIAPVNITTDNGSCGEKGLVTQHSCWARDWSKVYCCGPAPMMKGVAKICKDKHIDCEVSLENMMACGLGACLCCVEKTVKGNVCVCTEGPVFNINELTW